MEPTLGTTENPMSLIAAVNASQLIEPRAAEDLDSSDENTVKVDALTWKRSLDSVDCCSEGLFEMSVYVISYTDECAGRVFSFCRRCWTTDTGSSGVKGVTYSAVVWLSFIRFCSCRLRMLDTQSSTRSW
jgi:hypothetical protein